jgi:hypothetical protein
VQSHAAPVAGRKQWRWIFSESAVRAVW